MCGIAGFLSAQPLADDAAPRLGRMLDRLSHRGPDGRGRHVDPARGLAMGHTRLSIIDLETGAQPLRSGDLALTVNGEFYDYKPLRAELTRVGERFRTRSDSEVALALYRRHGLDFVHQLRGEFALALFDPDRSRLVLIRDRFGVRPLYVHRQRDLLVWGSEVKALLAHGRVPRRLSLRSALGQMMNLMVPGRSAFEEGEQLLPGHMMIVERAGDRLDVTTRRYWDLEFPRADEHAPDPDPDEWQERVASRLIDSVRARLEADVPVGCYLSGGIDSCAILGISGAMQQSRVKAFTVGFDQDAYDETAPAREMARSARAEHVIVELSGADLYGDSYVAAVRHAERAFYNPFSVAKWHLSRVVHEHGYRVVVTGEGADELFAGYPFFKQDLGLSGVAAANEVFRGATISPTPRHHPEIDSVCGFTPAWLHPWLDTLGVARALFSDDALVELGDYDPVTDLAASLDRDMVTGRHPLDVAQYTYVKSLLESQVLGWSGDRMDMAHSLETRPAFLDHHLADTATRVPPSLRVRDGVEKWILRESMRGLVPGSLYRRPKFAFMAPPSHTDDEKRRAAGALAARYLSAEGVADLGLFDPARVGAFLTQARSDRDPVRSVQSDAVLNQLLGLHILDHEL
jgi:asparagine synthase (glutamine-hydrolysing)